MADANVQRTDHAESAKHDESHPKHAAVGCHLFRDRRSTATPFSAKRNEQGDQEQQQKRQGGLQRKNHGKVEPHAVWIGASENKGWPHAADEHPKHSAQKDHRRQKSAAEEKRYRPGPEFVESVRGLMPG